MPLDTFLLFLAAWSLVALSPGPAVMFVMSQTARHGMRGGVAGTLGIVSGHLFTFSAVALGLAAVLAKYSEAVMAIRIVGALYLMYLGVKMLWSRPRAMSTEVASGAAPPARHGIVLQGLAVLCLSQVKAAELQVGFGGVRAALQRFDIGLRGVAPFLRTLKRARKREPSRGRPGVEAGQFAPCRYRSGQVAGELGRDRGMLERFSAHARAAL